MSELGPILPDLVTILDEEVENDLQVGTELPDSYGRAPLFNFDPNSTPGFELVGAQGLLHIADDQRTLLVWIQKAIRTPRGKYIIYGPDYGTDMAAGLGSLGTMGLIQNGEEDIRRCLLLHPLIQDIQDVTFEQTTEPDTFLIRLTVIDRIMGPLQIEIGI